MNYNFDLYIIDPLLICLGISWLILIFFRNKTNKKAMLFYFEILLIWIVNGIVAKQLSSELSNYLNLKIEAWKFTICLVLSASLFAVILKPLATFITGKIKWRKLWIYIGYGSSLISILILVFVNKQSLTSLLFLAILVGFSMSMSSLYYLFLNEQFESRVGPYKVGFSVSFIMLFATFISSYSLNFNNLLLSNDMRPTLYMALFFLVVTGVITIFNRESKENIGSFPEDAVKNLIKVKTNTIIALIIIGFCLGLSQEILKGYIFKFRFQLYFKYF